MFVVYYMKFNNGKFDGQEVSCFNKEPEAVKDMEERRIQDSTKSYCIMDNGKSYTIDERRNELLGKGYVIKSMGVDGLGVFIDFHKKDTNCYRKVYSTKRGEACLPPKNDFVTREYLYDDYLIITGACDEFKSAE